MIKSLFVLLLMSSTYPSGESIIRDNIKIILFPYEYENSMRAAAMPEIKAESELMKHPRRFEYLLVNISEMHQIEKWDERNEIGKLYPDTNEIKRIYMDKYAHDKKLTNYMEETYAAIKKTNKQKRTYSQNELLEVASKFFYCKDVAEDTTIQSYVCIGNNGVREIKSDKEHLEGALFVDLNKQLADIKTDFAAGGRHPLPKLEHFSKTLTDLGISKDNHIVIYDDKNGSNAAARFWWMLKSIGHKKVQVLNGGLNQAKKNNFPLSSKKESTEKVSQSYIVEQWLLPTIEINELEKVSNDPNYLIVDVRDKERYEGHFEPIDLVAGHIPGAINIPFTENLDQNGLFLSSNELKQKYETMFRGINPENIVIHCGSGVTACHTLLALDYAEMTIPKLYVGSWSEWSRNKL